MANYNKGTSPFSASGNSNTSASDNRKNSRRGRGSSAVWIFVLIAFLGGIFGDSGLSFYYFLLILLPLAVVGVVIFAVVRSRRNNDAAPLVPRSVVAGHLCEDGEHGPGSARSAAEALDEMESGYQAFSQTAAGQAAHESYVYKRIKKMTREEFEKKLEELDSLMDAGMITRAEYAEKRREYRNATA